MTKTFTLGPKGSQKQEQDVEPEYYDYDDEGIPVNHPELMSLDNEIAQVGDSLEKADEKFLNDEVSDQKHEEIVKRLKEKKKRLTQRRKQLTDNLTLKFRD
jgi:hypothetical protein